MKLQPLAVAAIFVAATSGALAGDFVTLRTDLSSLTAANGGLVTGAQSAGSDKFYIETTGATYLAGFDDLLGPSEGGTGNIVETMISYRTFNGSTTTSTGTLTLLDWRKTDDVPLLAGEPQATVFDFVYRDSADNKLVFATRYLNREANDQEANFLYRYGFTGLATAVAWTFASDFDLRMYQAGRTQSTSADPNVGVPFDAGAVRQRGDFSLSEGNPWSGLFFVKTDAQSYVLGDKAIGFFQTGEETQAPAGGFIGGFVPTPVPEPETYALLLLGLGFVGLAARRRSAA